MKKDKCNDRHVPAPHVALGVNFIWQPSLGKMVAMILEKSQKLRTDATQKNLLNLLTVGSPDMLPVPHRYGMSDDDGHVHHGILDTDALVRPASKDKVVSGVGLRRAFWI